MHRNASERAPLVVRAVGAEGARRMLDIGGGSGAYSIAFARFAALFALNMLVGTPGGSAYSEPEYAAWLGEAGFAEVHRVRLHGTTGLMIGKRP